MREPRPIRGSPLPLFDRLSERPSELSGDRNADRILDAPALRESVRQDLLRLLNTRATLRGVILQLAEGTVLDYGLPDLSSLTPASDEDRNLLARSVAARISAHEPRLRNVRVVITPHPTSPRSVQGAIMASLLIGQVYEPVTFHISMELGGKAPAVSLT